MPLSPEQSCFLHAIRSAPADGLVRLVYADWLDDHGYVDQAQLIRLQCEAHELRAADPHRAADLAGRAEAIIEAHGRVWAGELLELGAEGVEFDRGIMEGVRVCDDSLSDLGRLLDACPPSVHRIKVRHGKLSGPSPAPGALACAPASRRLDDIDLAGCPLSVAGLRALTESGHCEGLVALNLHRCLIADGGASVLALAPNLPALRRLDVGWNNIGADGVRALVGSPLAERLTHLDLSANWIGDEGVGAIAGSTNLRSLQSLVLQERGTGRAPWGASRQAVLSLAHADLPHDMELEFGGYKGSFEMFRRHPNWFTGSVTYEAGRQ